MLTLLGMLGVMLSVGLMPGVAKAGGGGGSTNQVTIQPQASYIFASSILAVGLYVKCQGGSGEVLVHVTQSPPATPYPETSGFGQQPVVCDGQTHSVAVSVTGIGFDAGAAWATAELTTGLTVVAQAQRWINIVVVTG
jgi:hypothetical protein